MDKQPTVIIGQGPVANAIAGQLAQAGHEVMQVALAGGRPAGLPAFVVPKQVWPLASRTAVAAPSPATVVGSMQADLGADGFIHFSVDAQPSFIPARLIIASSRAAAQLLPQLELKMPLRPVRCHTLEVKQATPMEDVTYLSRGGIYALPALPGILYDGLIDRRQATFLAAPDPAMQEALTDWLARRGTEPAGVPGITTTATTPDFLPAFGSWPDLPQLWLSVGWHIWGPAVAGSMAAKLAEMMGGDTNTDIEISRLGPARFHLSNWPRAERPAWLSEHAQPQLVGGQKEITRADTVNTIGSPTVERSKNVQLVDSPTVQRAGGGQINTRTSKGKAQVMQLGKK